MKFTVSRVNCLVLWAQSDNKVDHFSDLTQLSDHFFVLMEVNPVGFVDVPAAQSMYHVTILRVVNTGSLLSIDYVLCEAHLIHIRFLIKIDPQCGSWDEYWFGLIVPILHNLVRVYLPRVSDPFLVLDWGEEEISLFGENESQWVECIHLFVPFDAIHCSLCIPIGVSLKPQS